MKNSRRRVRELRSRRGATTVEMAVVFPVIMLFFAIMFETCRVLMIQHSADTAAYEGARAAMVPGATSSEAHQMATQLLYESGMKMTNVVVTPSVIEEDTPLITVQVDIPVNQNSWVIPTVFDGFTVTREVTLVCERSPIMKKNAMEALKTKKELIN